MKNLIFISILFIALTFSAVAQSPCPKNISVTGPSGIPRVGENMTFTAKVEGYDLDKIKYEWTVANGKIASGQGTTQIFVPAEKENLSEETATVKIIGLPEKCLNTASVSYACEDCGLTPRPPIRDPDYYRKLSWHDEKAILDSLAFELISDKNLIVRFELYTNEKNYAKALKARGTKIRNYLFKEFKIAKDRILVIYGGKGEYRTTVWLVPEGAMLPNFE